MTAEESEEHVQSLVISTLWYTWRVYELILQGVSNLINEQTVRELVGQLKDPFLHKTLAETEGITEVSIKEEKKHVSVKLALAKINTAEQLPFQMKVVDILKECRC